MRYGIEKTIKGDPDTKVVFLNVVFMNFKLVVISNALGEGHLKLKVIRLEYSPSQSCFAGFAMFVNAYVDCAQSSIGT